MRDGLIITNDKDRHAKVFRLMEKTKQNIFQFMVQWGGVLNIDLIRFTPPRGKNPGSETWPSQKKREDQIVDRDIRKVFRSGKQLMEIIRHNLIFSTHPRLLEQMQRYVDAGDGATLSRILYKIGIRLTLLPSPAPELHFMNRDSRGRVRKPKQSFYVLNDAAVSGYVSKVQKDVGKAKAGWVTRKMAVKNVPLWVRRHSMPDGSNVDLTGPEYRITFRNTSPASKGMRSAEMVDPVVAILETKMGKSLRAITHNTDPF